MVTLFCSAELLFFAVVGVCALWCQLNWHKDEIRKIC